MKVEKDKVRDVLLILKDMRDSFEKRMSPADTSRLRREAVLSVAESELHAGRYLDERSARNTVHSAIVPRLRPDVNDVSDFDELADQWLRKRSMKLKEILLKNTSDPHRRDEVVAFFGENGRQISGPAEVAIPTRALAKLEPFWLPDDEADGTKYSPQDALH